MPHRRSARPARALGVLVAAALTLTGLATAASADDQTGSISGHVSVPDNYSPSDVQVTVTSQLDGSPTSVVPAADGTYEADGLAAGSYTVEFAGAGDSDLVATYYGGATTAWQAAPVSVTSGSTATGIDANLVLGGRITGSVLDSSGQPATAATVRLLTAAGSWTALSGPVATDGTFVVHGVPAGSYLVQASASTAGATTITAWYGGTTQWTAARVAVQAGLATAIDPVELPTVGYLQGRVTAGGEPLASALVYLTPSDGSMGVSASTDLEGTFRVGVAAGSYKVQAYGPSGTAYVTTYWPGTTDYAQAQSVTVTADETTDLGDLALVQGESISGTVRGPDGEPLAGATVTASGAGMGMASTGPDGTYTITGLLPGSYQVQFSGPWGSTLVSEYYDRAHTWETATPVSVSGPTTGIDAQLQRAVCVTGTLLGSDGSPASGVSLELEPDQPQIMEAGATAGPDGTFTLPGGLAGDYRLRFDTYGTPFVAGYYPDAASSSDATTLSVQTGDCLDLGTITIPVGGSVTGRVVGSDGAPVADTMVLALDAEGRGSNAMTDADGRYEIVGLATGDYAVRAVSYQGSGAQAYYPASATRSGGTPVHVVQGQGTALPGDLKLIDDGTISGDVVDPTGAPVPFQAVIGEGPDAMTDGPTYGRSEDDGSFTLAQIEAAPTLVQAVSDDPDAGYRGVRTYYDGGSGTPLRSKALPIVPEPGGAVSGIHIVMPPRGSAVATLQVSTSPSTPVGGRRVTVHVAAAGDAGTPGGAIELDDEAGALLGDAMLDATGHADITFVVPTGWSATPTVALQYSGDATYDAQGTSVPFDTQAAPPAPTVTAVDPASGSVLGGTTVHVTGTGFTDGTTVTFGGAPATDVTVESSTSLVATAPAHAAGTVPVAVTADGGTSDPGPQFTYEALPTTTTLTSSASPAAPGHSVTFTATVAGPSGSPSGSVAFTIGAAAPVTVPLVAGVATLTVDSLAAGTTTVAAAYTGDGTFQPSSAVLQQVVKAGPAPVLARVQTPTGCTAGGTTVTLTGSHLTGATAVTFDTTPGTHVEVLGDDQVRVRTPAHAAGTVSVRVTTSAGTSNAVTFRYVPSNPASCTKG